LGTQLVSKSNPDGFTLLAHSSTFFTAPLILSNAGYDPIKDFAPVSLTCKAAMVLVTGAQQPIQSVADVIQQAKARPEGLTVASSGNGSTGHIASEVFSNRAGIRMLNIFYKGNAQSVVDVISGQTQLMFDQISTSLSHIRSEKIRPIAVTSLNRSLLLPGIPSIAESGFPGYEDVTINMLLAPAGTPKEIVQRLHAEIVKAYAQAELVGSFAERGIELVASPSPEDFGLLIKSEVARLTKVSRSAGIKAE
jgi:tripartite-type tricarboxylate transporter receptor subunit TctC